MIAALAIASRGERGGNCLCHGAVMADHSSDWELQPVAVFWVIPALPTTVGPALSADDASAEKHACHFANVDSGREVARSSSRSCSKPFADLWSFSTLDAVCDCPCAAAASRRVSVPLCRQENVDDPSNDQIIRCRVRRQVQRNTPRSTQPETLERRRRLRLVASVGRHTPTLCVMLALAGLGIYGHHSDWKLPKFSALDRQRRGASGTIGARNMACRNRSASSATRTCCREARITAGARSTAFTNCPLCHPEVAQLKQTPAVDRGGSAAGGPGVGRGPAAGEQRRLQELPPANPVRVPGSGEEGGGGRGVGGSTADRRVDFGQRPDHLRPDPLCQPLVASAGDGVARGEERRRPGSGGRSPGPGRCGRGGPGQDGTDPSPGPGRTAEEGRQPAGYRSRRKASWPGVKSQTAQAEYVQARARLLSAQQALGESRPAGERRAVAGLPEEKLAERLRLLGLPEYHRTSISARTRPQPISFR